MEMRSMGLWLARKVQLMARARVDVGEVFRDGPRVEIVGADGRQAMDTLREEGDSGGAVNAFEAAQAADQ